MKRVLIAAVAAVAVVAALMVVPASSVGAASPTTIYDSTQAPLPGNQVSECFECAQASEIGNQVAFTPGSPRLLSSVVVTLSSWGCQSGTWTNGCETAPGATFSTPITLNLYNVGSDGTSVGSQITSVTQTFSVPYRPSADPTDCPSTPTEWYDAADATCDNGLATNVTFTLGHVVVPDKVVYGIALDTSDYGANPVGDGTACHATPEGCGYDSLNVALSDDPPGPGTGSDPIQNGIYWNTQTASNYCDGGASGVGTFRLDEGCWQDTFSTSPQPQYWMPAVQFNAVANSGPSITSPSSLTLTTGTAYNLPVTTTGIVPMTITQKGKLPEGLSFSDGGNGTATITGTPSVGGVYNVRFKASNHSGKATQTLGVTVDQAPFVTTGSTYSVKAGKAFSIRLVAKGYPTTITLGTAGSVPAGVGVVSNGNGTGKLTGTLAAGIYSVDLTASSSSGATDHLVTIYANAP